LHYSAAKPISNRKPDRKAAKDLPIRMETRGGHLHLRVGGRQWPAAEHPKPSSLCKIPCLASLDISLKSD
jgi:hypothetical protein